LKCPRCQHENSPQAKFCGECGTRALPTAEPHFGSPNTYTPAHLAERILTSRAALEGERKQVTVLFADLKGSMELLLDRDPEDARQILDPVLERMMEAVHRYEGTVNQVMGDGIMALFGAPIALEDHAVRACYAALWMQESVTKYAGEVLRSHGVTLRIRVGLNSGEVVVRTIGSDLKMDYSAVGATTHLAARMEQLADPGSILLPLATFQLVEGQIEVKERGPVPVKGLPEPVEVYELVGTGSVRSRLQAAALHGLTRFVGRDAEMEQLHVAMERAGSGHGQVVAVIGDPGVGKSRLYWEFARSHGVRSWLILESRSVSYGRATSYLPVIDMLKGYFGIEARDEPRRMRAKVTGKLLNLDEALWPMLPAFLALLDLPLDDATWQTLDPSQRRQRTVDAVKRLLLCESAVQPIVAVFEDLHWIDSETQAILDSLVESLPTARLLLLVNYRPEYRHQWGSKTYYRQIQVDPLLPESAEQLLQHLLGTDAALAPLSRLLVQRTEGNPFFLEESVRSLVETATLTGTRGAYRLATALPKAQTPATVQAVVAARMDRLPLQEKRLLQSAAVIGKDVPLALLQSIAELSEDDFHRSLSTLRASEFVYETTLYPDLEYTFKHALTHEVAYGSLLGHRRASLHAQIVAAIERLYPDRVEELIERLAQHAFRGEQWTKAFPYLRHAGQKAFRASANTEAASYFEQALAALAHLPQTPENLQGAIDVRFDLRNSLYPLGEFERILDRMQEAERIAQVLGDRPRSGRAFLYMSQHFWWTGEPHRATDCVQRTLAIAQEVADIALEATATYYLGVFCHTLGDYRRAIEVLEKGIESLREGVVYERQGIPGILSVCCRTWLVQCFVERGEFASGIARGEEAVQIAESFNHPFSLAQAYFSLGFLYLRQGVFGRAIPLLERGIEVCRVWDIRIWLPRMAAALGAALALSGRASEAVPLLEQAVGQAMSPKMMIRHILPLTWLAEAYVLVGRSDEAATLAGRCADLARDHAEHGHEAWTVRLLGEIASTGESAVLSKEAESYFERAFGLATERGMRPLVAHCHVGLAVVQRKKGNSEAARAHRDQALTLFRETGMSWWSAEAEGRLAGLP
jgi:class 3 adenylate cyclase/tetratricopeptide (TPR) repeat protein